MITRIRTVAIGSPGNDFGRAILRRRECLVDVDGRRGDRAHDERKTARRFSATVARWTGRVAISKRPLPKLSGWHGANVSDMRVERTSQASHRDPRYWSADSGFADWAGCRPRKTSPAVLARPVPGGLSRGRAGQWGRQIGDQHRSVRWDQDATEACPNKSRQPE